MAQARVLNADELNAIAKSSGYTGGPFSSVGLTPSPGSRSLNMTAGNDTGVMQQGQAQAQSVAQSADTPVTNFNSAITGLLQKYQQLGTKGFVTQGQDAQQLQADRIAAPTSPDMIGAAPSLQNSVRSNSASAVTPTINSAQDSAQTFGEQLNSFGDTVESARSLMRDYEATQNKTRDDARAVINQILTTTDPSSLKGLDIEELTQLEKVAGYPKGFLSEAVTYKQKQADNAKTFSNVDLGDKIGILDNNGNVVRTIPKGIDPNRTTPGVTPLSAGQKEEIATGNVLAQMADQALTLGEKIKWSGIGGLGRGSISQFGAKQFGLGTSEEQDLKNLIGNIKGTIAKLRGGTSFTTNEQALLDTYVPGINDSPLVLKSKLNSLKQFVKNKNEIIQAGSGGGQAPTSNTPSAANNPVGI